MLYGGFCCFDGSQGKNKKNRKDRQILRSSSERQWQMSDSNGD